jgi:putative transposase
MKLSRRTYYHRPQACLDDPTLLDRIEQICLELPRYGYRRVTHQLQREGLSINHKKVSRIMREHNWVCRRRTRHWIATTDSRHRFPVYPNRIANRLVNGLNQVWVADLTYIHILVCFIYLAVILDVFSRKVIGYAISRNLDTELTLAALRMAVVNRNPPPGCIHHSDRGVQYAAEDYVNELQFHRFQISMSRKANPLDNAYVESFIKTLKSEEVYLWEYRTIEDVQRRIPYFIEDVYNQKRLHSALGYCPPCEFETMITSNPDPAQGTLILAV